ncbi:MAG: copper chaperone PCu(A)C [Alphaproteobacteria bacterium]|nr:copper chaperone PCu(A)C [Alphaproteobacteria bacterium]
MSKLFAAALAAMLLIAGAARAQTGQLEVKDAWARATPGNSANGAAYVTIVSPVPDRLTGVTTPVAQKAGLHEMSMAGGVMKMRPLDGLDLPAGQPMTLKPGGTHIMLESLKQPLRDGQSFPLTLTFDKAGTREITVAVEKAGAMGPPGAMSGGTPGGAAGAPPPGGMTMPR